MGIPSEELALKKFLIYFFSLVSIGFIGVVVMYGGWIFPVEDISGCYSLSTKKYVDKVCLYPDGRYEQLYSEAGSEFKKYNSNSWRSFPYSNDSGDFVAGSLNQFITRDSSGGVGEFLDIDIQPHKNMLGKVLFSRGMNSSSERQNYYRE